MGWHRHALGDGVERAHTSNHAEGGGQRRLSHRDVSIDNFSFSPKTLTVAPGQAITWINHDDVPHRIESANGKFAPSKVLDTKGTFVATLSKAGEYPYFCSLHPTMTGKIVVR